MRDSGRELNFAPHEIDSVDFEKNICASSSSHLFRRAKMSSQKKTCILTARLPLIAIISVTANAPQRSHIPSSWNRHFLPPIKNEESLYNLCK